LSQQSFDFSALICTLVGFATNESSAWVGSNGHDENSFNQRVSGSNMKLLKQADDPLRGPRSERVAATIAAVGTKMRASAKERIFYWINSLINCCCCCCCFSSSSGRGTASIRGSSVIVPGHRHRTLGRPGGHGHRTDCRHHRIHRLQGPPQPGSVHHRPLSDNRVGVRWSRDGIGSRLGAVKVHGRQ
jgi:hypothetical protein